MKAKNGLQRMEGSSNREFGLVFTLLLFSWSMWNLIRNDRVTIWSWVVATILLAISFFTPQILSLPNFLWTKFGIALSRITGPIALLVLFIVVFTPYNVILRILRRDLLNLQYSPSLDSYWTQKQKNNSWTDFERQF